MSIPDAINGAYELCGGFFLLANCIRLYKDKEVKGVNLWSAVFFSTWSWWNLYYYPSLNQWCSFYGGLIIAITNATWSALALYYTFRKK
jgi:ABC-type transport system involved in cytochrome c biogenesis permease subunit